MLGEHTLFALQISTTPLPGCVHIFQQYLQYTCVSIHVRRDVREALFKNYCPFHTTDGMSHGTRGGTASKDAPYRPRFGVAFTLQVV